MVYHDTVLLSDNGRMKVIQGAFFAPNRIEWETSDEQTEGPHDGAHGSV